MATKRGQTVHCLLGESLMAPTCGAQLLGQRLLVVNFPAQLQKLLGSQVNLLFNGLKLGHRVAKPRVLQPITFRIKFIQYLFYLL